MLANPNPTAIHIIAGVEKWDTADFAFKEDSTALPGELDEMLVSVAEEAPVVVEEASAVVEEACMVVDVEVAVVELELVVT